MDELPAEAADAIHGHFVERGGEDAPEIRAHEVWRTYLLDATFTIYRSGTLYSTASAKRGRLGYVPGEGQ